MTAIVTTMRQSDIRQCPHCIMVPEHYRQDGSCRCEDPLHLAMIAWQYRWDIGKRKWVGAPRPKPASSRFRFLTGDMNYLSYGGTWVRKVDAEYRYHLIRLINWQDAVGELDAAGEPTYNMELVEVDLAAIPEAELVRAAECCDTPTTAPLAWRAGDVASYGLFAPLRSTDTNNFRQTFAELARYSLELTSDYEAYQEAMNRPVNGIGSTAAEYMRGDIYSPLARGLAAGDQKAQIMAKMYGMV